MKRIVSSIWAAALFAVAIIAALLPIGVVATAAARVYQGFMPLMKELAHKGHDALFGYMSNRGMILGANTLTRMIPDLYESLDIISRELVGFIPAVTLDASMARGAVNQEVVIPITPTSSSSDVTPGVTAPNTGDQNLGNTTFKITKAKAVPFRWNGEEQRGVNTGAGYRKIRNDQMLQAMRTLVNEIEVDVGNEARLGSRAFGTSGTTPFATNLSDLNNSLKIMQDNGAPLSDMQMVINTTAGLSLRNLQQLQKVNESGDQGLLRQGILGQLSNFNIRESAGVATVTKGTGAGYLVNNVAGYAIGATSIALDTGTGTVLAGDYVTFAGDTNKYLVATALTGGVVVLAAPGLRQTLADNVAMTVGNNFTANPFFDRSAIVLATRVPARPEEGDMADDVTIITDPRSGLSFEVAIYKQYRQVYYEIAAAWGQKNIKPAHSGVLLG
jgi:hypothetical protein